MEETEYVSDAELIAQAEMSPCVGVCAMDQETEWCFGCGRTVAEIRDWQNYDQSQRENLQADLTGRVNQLLERRRAERGTSRRGRRARS